MSTEQRRHKGLKNWISLAALTLILTGCDLDVSKLPATDIDTVIAVTNVKDAKTALSLSKIYVLEGKYVVQINGKQVEVPPGVAIDVYTYQLYSFNMEEFMKLYKGKFQGLE